MESGRVVTIMHVDVAGSTALTTRAGDEAGRRVLTATKELVRERVEAHGGRQIDAVGDAMMLTFASTRAAIAAATEIQETLAARERELPDETLRVRVGINVGEVLGADSQPFGAAVNAGARVMALADGGQVFVSEMAQRLAGTVPGVTYRDRGRHAFKGFDEPWRVYEVVWDGAPPPRPRPRRRPGRRLVALVVVLVAAAAVAGVLVATRGSTAGARGLAPNTLGLLDPATGRFTHTVAVGGAPIALARSGATLWVGNFDGQSASRVDTRSASVVATVPLGGHPTSIVADPRGAWIAEAPNRRLERIDSGFDRVTVRVAVGEQPTSLTVAGGFLWDTTGTDLERRSLATGALLARTQRDLGASVLAATAAPETLWVVGSRYATPLDPRTGATVGSPIGLAGYAITSAAASVSSLWVLSTKLQQLDARAQSIVRTVSLPVTPQQVAGGQLVAATPASAYVADISGARVVDADGRSFRVGASPRALLGTAEGVWVAAS